MPIQTLKVGSLGTHNALGLAKAKNARFLLASTSEVYGDPLVHPQREDYWGNVNPVGPRGVYDEAKRFAEAMTMAYHRVHGVQTRIVRIFNTYGPRMRVEDGRAIPAFLSQALRNEDVTVFGDGSQTRSLCYVSDLVDGHLPPDGVGRGADPVNIGNPQEMTIRQLAEQIIALTGSRSRIVQRPLPVDDPKVRQPDITRARTLLGWEPKVPLDEGLRQHARLLQAQARRQLVVGLAEHRQVGDGQRGHQRGPGEQPPRTPRERGRGGQHHADDGQRAARIEGERVREGQQDRQGHVARVQAEVERPARGEEDGRHEQGEREEDPPRPDEPSGRSGPLHVRAARSAGWPCRPAGRRRQGQCARGWPAPAPRR